MDTTDMSIKEDNHKEQTKVPRQKRKAEKPLVGLRIFFLAIPFLLILFG